MRMRASRSLGSGVDFQNLAVTVGLDERGGAGDAPTRISCSGRLPVLEMLQLCRVRRIQMRHDRWRALAEILRSTDTSEMQMLVGLGQLGYLDRSLTQYGCIPSS